MGRPPDQRSQAVPKLITLKCKGLPNWEAYIGKGCCANRIEPKVLR
jgi:hypothetical protein